MPTYTSPQDGTTLDAYILSAAANSNTSTYDDMAIGESNASADIRRTLLQFPGLTNGTIPAGAVVTSASLFLKIKKDLSSNARTFYIYRSKRDVVISQCTWNIWKTSNNWSTAGGFHADDTEQTPIASCSFSATESVDTWKEFVFSDLTALTNIINGSWATPTLFGKADTEANDMYVFYSSNHATSTNRPYIVVNYVLGGGSFPIFFD